MDALQKAIDIEFKNYQHDPQKIYPSKLVGIAFALCRLLVEPRDEEKSKIPRDPTKKIGSMKHHPSKRDLSVEEEVLYNQIKDILLKADSITDQVSNDDRQMLDNLGLAHYKLGVFFRKLQPESKHRPNSLHHFKKCIIFLSLNHSLYPNCQFWIATFGMDDNEDVSVDDSNTSACIIDRCPEEYVISLYSSFAAKFDDLLVNKLKYQTPTKLRQVVDNVKQKLPLYDTITKSIGVDLGCGTGLSGLAFQQCVDNLYGIDLSPEMIEKAKLRKCYKDLYVGELEIVFKDIPELHDIQYNLIVACDVFVYIGQLKQIFQSVYKKLLPKFGLFAFSTECLDESSCGDKPFMLHKCARFGHKTSYIKKISEEVGFDVKYLEKSVIRRNKENDVTGLLVVLSC